MPKINKKVFVALSGGVDSSVTALLLKEAGFDVTGVHIKMWSPYQSLRDATGQADPSAKVCEQQYQDRIDAMRVAAKLDIPFETWDFTDEYKSAVVDYMVREYAEGRTPNPDVMCNRKIKFGVFFNRARLFGADFVATGHYVKRVEHNDVYALERAADKQKDQSYFLWPLTQNELSKAIFPLGDKLKTEVRKIAEKAGLPTAKKKDSQGICFIGKLDMREFLKEHIAERRGLIYTTGGKKIGSHSGLEFYTLGQRHGIAIGGGIPYYVAQKDFSTNTLVVAEGDTDPWLFRKSLLAHDLNWISGKTPIFPLECQARIRYRQPLQACRVWNVDGSGNHNPQSTLHVQFNEPQRAVTPGQSIVFYKDDPFDKTQGGEMLGGGVIQ